MTRKPVKSVNQSKVSSLRFEENPTSSASNKMTRRQNNSFSQLKCRRSSRRARQEQEINADRLPATLINATEAMTNSALDQHDCQLSALVSCVRQSHCCCHNSRRRVSHEHHQLNSSRRSEKSKPTASQKMLFASPPSSSFSAETASARNFFTTFCALQLALLLLLLTSLTTTTTNGAKLPDIYWNSSNPM